MSEHGTDSLIIIAREELLFRVRHRDAWLKLNLLAQATLWALSQGIQLGGASADAPISSVAPLACPVALVFAIFYYVEDGIIHRLGKYVARKDPSSWDNSAELKTYATGLFLILRMSGQIVAFCVLPLYLSNQVQAGNPVALVATLVTLLVVGVSYRERRGSGGDA